MLVCALWSVLAMAPDPAGSTGAGELQETLAAVRAAEALIGEFEQRGHDELEARLTDLHDLAPRLAADVAAQEARALAQLTLAQVRLALGTDAAAAMDEALRTARGQLDTSEYGDDVVALARERLAALEGQGRGTLEVKCPGRCEVFVNERPAGATLSGLLTGPYRVWVETTDGPHRETVTVRMGETVTVDLVGVSNADTTGPPPPTIPTTAGTTPVDPGPMPPPAPDHRRLLPRWASIGLATLSLAAVGSGVALLAIDGRCQGPNKDLQTCPRVYRTTTAGAATVATGGVAFVVSVPILIVDESRGRR